MTSTRIIPAVLAAAAAFGLYAATPASAATIIDEWKSVEAPPAPKLKKVTVDPKTTALIVMDLQTNSCNEKRRPRCVDSIPHVKTLLDHARAKKMHVIYTITSSRKITDVLDQIAPKKGEPYVKASVDKFYDTDLQKMLKARNVDTVILVGTAAEGAVLGTATGAALRDYKVIVPVDGMSSTKYAEQYTAEYLVSSPGTKKAVTLTSVDRIDIK